MVKLDQTLAEIPSSCFCLSRSPAYEGVGGGIAGCGCFVNDGFRGYVREVDGGGFIGVLGSGFPAEDRAGDRKDTLHVDWEGLMRLYGAGDLDEFGRFRRDASERGGGGGEALGATAEGTFLCSKGAGDVDESGWHNAAML